MFVTLLNQVLKIGIKTLLLLSQIKCLDGIEESQLPKVGMFDTISFLY